MSIARGSWLWQNICTRVEMGDDSFSNCISYSSQLEHLANGCANSFLEQWITWKKIYGATEKLYWMKKKYI